MGNLPHNYEHCRVFKEGICQIDNKVCGLLAENKIWCLDYKQKQKIEEVRR